MVYVAAVRGSALNARKRPFVVVELGLVFFSFFPNHRLPRNCSTVLIIASLHHNIM